MRFAEKQRLSDASFLLWISSPSLSRHFDFFERFLQSDCTDLGFVSQFLSPEWISGFYQDSRDKPLTPFSSLFKPNDAVSQIVLGEIFVNEYEVPDFFARPIMARLNPEMVMRGMSCLKFSELAPIGPALMLPSVQERIFSLLKVTFNRDYLLSGDLSPFIMQFLLSTKGFESLTDSGVRSLFTSYILARLNLLYDPEFRGRILWRQLHCFDFESQLRSIARLQHFQTVYRQWKTLDLQNREAISYDEFVHYDSDRIHPAVMQRIWRFLPGDGKRDGQLSFGGFAFFLLLLEDKSTPASLNFWWKVCDLDEDGILSLGEMNTVYGYQKQQLRELQIMPEKFKSMLCEVMDMMGRRSGSLTQLTKADLRNSGHWGLFFNFLFDSRRFAQWTLKDPLYWIKARSKQFMNGQTPWDVYCEEAADDD
jgi:hypothetical protein